MDISCDQGIIFFLIVSSLIFHSIPASTDTINSTQRISDGETLVSSGGTFELGFFSPGNSTNRYVGMWYRNLTGTIIVWVANREVPITNTTGVFLTVTEPGILVLINDAQNQTIWSSNNTLRAVQNPIAQLLDSGNLVVRDLNDDRPENFLWQSFNYPTDTYLPGMRMGWNFVTGLEVYIRSWRSNDDPAPGDISYHLDPTGYPQLLLKRGDEDVVYRIGPWNGIRFSGSMNSIEDPTYNLSFVMNENELQYWETSLLSSVFSRITVNQSGDAQRWTWIDRRGWVAYINMPVDLCDTYGLCGPYGICNVGNSPPCGCLDRFVPQVLNDWLRTDWTSGCVRRTNLSCGGDVFRRYSGIKLPDVRFSWQSVSMTIQECRAECLRNCSCTAYTQLDISRRSGCLIWYTDLIDIRSFSPNGQDIYIRLASSESGKNLVEYEKFGNMNSLSYHVIFIVWIEIVAESEGKNRTVLIASLASVIGVVLIGLVLFLCIWKRKNYTKIRGGLQDRSHKKDSELQLFNLSTILKATNNFSFNNKLGEGGFGTVYMGILEGGQEIAVKRLSKNSMQGLDELKNEVVFIAKLQHRNLVRLLGCCIQEEENKTKGMLLDWEKRFNIINGVARGLLYLHQDSRLRIIHRDLKASNVLLDSDMNPKISDFGMARSFVGNETQAKTRRVVGTYGYMSPEYAVDGLFSVKSDVFSFGVLVLEIVSGKRNRGFSHIDHNLNLLGHAWTLYKEDRPLDLVDASLGNSFYFSDVVRSVHVALLCVQQNPKDRPSMSSVVMMLCNEDVLLPQSKQPGFFNERDVLPDHGSTSTNAATSTNEMTITMPEGR
ncbi:hypothetical protein RD792_002773 [Penstemon davidsonii]|uniref:Receptor-like serine/threonine-protein kinase n=1 Tax=Penstemon davidsonii TaxID=160366 RepID=A0ABR0DRY0_9LAMI|nr:hypothetical protein RD792_002773 [Penstemon davidsonii]